MESLLKSKILTASILFSLLALVCVHWLVKIL